VYAGRNQAAGSSVDCWLLLTCSVTHTTGKHDGVDGLFGTVQKYKLSTGPFLRVVAL
jgi:hypothetical protein